MSKIKWTRHKRTGTWHVLHGTKAMCGREIVKKDHERTGQDLPSLIDKCGGCIRALEK